MSATFTIAETAGMVTAIGDAILDGEPLKRLNLLLVARKLIDRRNEDQRGGWAFCGA